MKLVYGYQSTKSNNEDFAITPYLFGVLVNGKILKVFGIGLCWGWASFYIGFGLGIPKNL